MFCSNLIYTYNMITHFGPHTFIPGVINRPEEVVHCLGLIPRVCFWFLIQITNDCILASCS